MIKLLKKISLKSLWATIKRVMKDSLLVFAFLSGSAGTYHLLQPSVDTEPSRLEITIEIKMPDPASKVQDGEVKDLRDMFDSLSAKPYMDGNSIQAFLGRPELS